MPLPDMPHGHQPAADMAAFLTESELAARWRISKRTLQRRRKAGQVPDYIELNDLIRYPIASVLAFEEKHLKLVGES